MTIHSSCSIDAPRSTRMTDRDVDTTRLSSTTMKSAIAVITKVHAVRVPDLTVTSRSRRDCDLVTDYSRVGQKREELSRFLLSTTVGQAGCPGVLGLVRDRVVHRSEHVHEHAFGAEERDSA